MGYPDLWKPPLVFIRKPGVSPRFSAGCQAEELPKLLKEAIDRRDVPKLREARSGVAAPWEIYTTWGIKLEYFFLVVLKQIQEISWELYDLINHSSGIWAFMGISYGIMEMKITKYGDLSTKCGLIICSDP